MQHAVFVAEKALFERPTELFDELFLGHAETDRLARKPAVGGRSYAQCATAADQRQATDDGKPFRFHGPCVFMSDRYGSYRRDRFVFGPESTVVPLVVRFVSSLFFSLYERLWRGATVVAETVWRSRSARPCFPLIRFDGNRRSTVRPVALPVCFGRTVARAFRPSLSVPGTCFF